MYKLQDLPYEYDALEPQIDARTMEIHHTKHHNAYVTNLNGALELVGEQFHGLPLARLLTRLDQIPEQQRTVIRNNGGGHYNHSLFWQIMTTGGKGTTSLPFQDAIVQTFGSFEELQALFSQGATARFGSGWAWLYVDTDGDLAISSSPNQDNPIIEGKGIPILGLDVWEHAYYLNYQNRRPDYIKAWWEVVDWEEVARRYEEITTSRDFETLEDIQTESLLV